MKRKERIKKLQEIKDRYGYQGKVLGTSMFKVRELSDSRIALDMDTLIELSEQKRFNFSIFS